MKMKAEIFGKFFLENKKNVLFFRIITENSLGL